MIANLLLHVHDLPEGRVVVTPIDFPRISVDADSYENAVKTVLARLESALKGSSSGSLRSSLARPESAELDEVEIELPEKLAGSGKPKITIGLVVTLRPTSHGELYVVKAPEIPDVEVAVKDRDEAVAAAKEALEQELADWDLRWLLACDLTGTARLESIEVPLPATTRATGNDDHDSFDVAQAAEDLRQLAGKNCLGHFDGRDELLSEALHVLTSPGPSSVMLVGPHDVGKTALVHQIARQAATADGSGDPGDALAGRPILRISANELIAGARYTGMWQERARLLIELGRVDGAIFVMDDPMSIIDAGRWSESDNNLSRVLRPYIESGDLTLICECTEEAYAAANKRELGFIKAFTRIEVSEPGRAETLRIIDTEMARVASRESVEFEQRTASGAVELTSRFQPYLAQPGKTIRLINAVARRHASDGEDASIGCAAVAEEFARQTGLPLLVLSDDVQFDRDAARDFFEERVLGQRDAVDVMVDLISKVKAGLSDPGKPLGVYFCIGPTGVGKTELTKALAEYLFGSRDRIIRFDMGEYVSSDAVARLVGNKWDRDAEGELTRRVSEQPFSVVLLDEFEKANPRVFDVLLSVLGEGRLTDPSGRTADFRNAIIVMTSNLGAERSQTRVVGFSEDADVTAEADRLRAHFVEQTQKFFRPEFFNRIDQVLAFRPLDDATINKIARRELGRLLHRHGIVSRQLLVEIDDAVVDAMARAGLDPKYGARPLQRQIERRVIQPLARLIVEQRPAPGDLIRLAMNGDQVHAELRKVKVADATRTRQSFPSSEEIAPGALLRRVELLFEQVSTEDESEDLCGRLREERSQLVVHSNRPSFWDDPENAKQTLARLYQIDRALERFGVLLNRAAGLVELARIVEQTRDRGRQGELRRAVVEAEDELVAVRLELAGALAGPDQGAARLQIVPVAGAGEWADRLVGMYATWADRSGREVETLADREIRISGVSSYELLKGESGMHRHVNSTDENLARVVVSAGQAEALPVNGNGTDEIVRVYSEGKHQFVRDPRTGTRVGDVNAVLRGRIDDFLIREAAWRDLGA